MAKVIKINHVAIAVNDLQGALSFWTENLGLKLDHVETVLSEQVEVAFLPVGDSEIELVKPTAEDTGLAKYIQKRGTGLHHLCLQVDDIAGMLEKMRHDGVRLINEAPIELPGRKMAFIHPSSANGVLVELYELTD